MKSIRLDKLLASENLGSRKEVAKLIKAGLVTVNGEVAVKADMKIDTAACTVTVNGEAVEYREHVYIMMNKPAGVVSATEDNRDATVLDILPPDMLRKNLFPAGRLDKDTTGLLIITDDGAFAHRMLSPKSHIYKIYEAALEKPVTDEDIKAFEAGISFGGEEYAPAKLSAGDASKSPSGYMAVVMIREGKFHQVKRMFEARGNRVLALKRAAIGGLKLDENLAQGESKYTSKELSTLL